LDALGIAAAAATIAVAVDATSAAGADTNIAATGIPTAALIRIHTIASYTDSGQRGMDRGGNRRRDHGADKWHGGSNNITSASAATDTVDQPIDGNNGRSYGATSDRIAPPSATVVIDVDDADNGWCGIIIVVIDWQYRIYRIDAWASSSSISISSSSSGSRSRNDQ